MWSPSLQITWAGVDPIMRTVKAAASSGALPQSTVARFSHPSFSQLMSEYLVAHVINAERNFYKVSTRHNYDPNNVIPRFGEFPLQIPPSGNPSTGQLGCGNHRT